MQTAVKEKDTMQRNLAHTQSALEHSQGQNTELHRDIVVLNTKIADLLKKMSRDDENTKKALEKAITASVRLCVVAPTVNVHVSDKKLKFKAG
jgi:predicted  nucleic acid-binding Zn-ribbon protein